MSSPLEMSRLNRLTSFLDRFEEQLEVDCEKLKRDLVAKVDRQFGVLKAKVRELKSNIGGCIGGGVVFDRSGLLDGDPKVENVSLEEWRHDQRQAAVFEQQSNVPSTSSGRKRASHSQTGSTPSKKRKSIQSDTNQTKKFVCKFEGCGQSFRFNDGLKNHERMHFDIKPYSCTWPNCGLSSAQRNNIVLHVRRQHFKLPKTKKEQQRLNIIDERDPNEYVQVNNQLVERRLE